MASTRPYYAERGLSAAFYDTVTAADPRLPGDLDIYAGLAPQGGTILELGAGTGRLAFGLAARGFSVVGIEIAPAMLAQASAKRAELDPAVAARVELKRADMTALDLKRTFDLVVCPYFTLSHVPRGLAQHLRDDRAAPGAGRPRRLPPAAAGEDAQPRPGQSRSAGAGPAHAQRRTAAPLYP